MIKNNIKSIFVLSVLIFSASGMVQNNAYAASPYPNMGTANNFAVLGSSTITNTGNTSIIGNVGVSPGTAITGFPPGMVTGITYTGGQIATKAHSDASIAYNTLSNARCTVNGPDVAKLGGQTLRPGVYCFPTSAAITGTLTLSGSGIYIFKIGSTLDTAAGNSKVVLTKGALAENIFWHVGSSATLGTDSVLKGTVIAYSSITSTTGATVDGRLIALNGAVTLDTSHITIVAPHTHRK
ncbi:MAG: ice-binding family protein [Nitrosarchaeum sp.]